MRSAARSPALRRSYKRAITPQGGDGDTALLLRCARPETQAVSAAKKALFLGKKPTIAAHITPLPLREGLGEGGRLWRQPRNF